MKKDRYKTVDDSVMDSEMNTPCQNTPFPEFGSFRDNLSAFEIALYYIEQGQEEAGFKILFALHKHIMRQGDLKSLVWLKGPLESIMRSGSLLEVGTENRRDTP